MPTVIRASRLLAVAILIGWSAAQIWFRVTDWSLSDMDAYWNAAMRLRDGELLYPPISHPSAPDVYRYSPWFAAMWVPVTFAPRILVELAWSALLLVSAALCLRPLMRADLTSLAAAFFFGSFLVWGASVGNIQALLIAGLMHGLGRRSGPAWVGVAASLKAVPILFLLVYIGRGEWRRAIIGFGVAVALSAPFLLVDLAHYPAGVGDAPSPLWAIAPVLLGVAVVLAGAVTVALARRRSSADRLAAAITALTALPRITLLDTPLLLVGIRPNDPPTRNQA